MNVISYIAYSNYYGDKNMYCKECGSEYIGRTNSTYCSQKCKQRAYRNRTGLSDNAGYSVSKYQTFSHLNTNQLVTNRITNGMLNGVSGGLQNTLSDGLTQMTNINNDPFYTMTLLLSASLGGYVGYNMSDKGKRLTGVILGAGGGLMFGNLAFSLYIQLKNYTEQKTLEQAYKQEQEQMTVLSDAKVYTSNEVRYMNVNTIKFDGIYSNFIGEKVNYGFSMLVYGSAGSGKSHFSTALAKYLERMGNVLYVLAEEGITNSVQSRIEKYQTQNTDYLQTRKEQDVLDKLPQYKFVIIDSINGMMNYNNHLDFLRKIKQYKNLYGIILLNQVNKDGAFTGKNELLHEVDVEVSIDSGIAETRKNRFDYSGKKLNIFPNSYEVTKYVGQNEYSKIIGN